MDDLKYWLKFWFGIACVFLGIVVSIGGCTAYTNKQSLDALKAGVSGVDVNIAIGTAGDAIKTIAVTEKNKKSECAETPAK